MANTAMDWRLRRIENWFLRTNGAELGRELDRQKSLLNESLSAGTNEVRLEVEELEKQIPRRLKL